MGLLEKNLLPDFVIRKGIRGLLKNKLEDESRDGTEFGYERLINFVNHLKASPIAINTKDANEQHYELPTSFFKLILGRHMKYSSGYWREGVADFDQSESDMLEITTERADIHDGDHILELGCGWGSLTLFMAEKYPHSKITAVSNSKTQKEYIDQQALHRGLSNVSVVTEDMNTFTINKKFDRVVSVEMFEHMRNYEQLLEKIARFLNSDGKLFIHIFTHKEYAYEYKLDDSGSDWMARYFFTGGIMPSDHLLLYFQKDFQIEHHWRVSGTHYQKTSEAWLKNMDANKDKIMPIISETYGSKDALKWWVYWRVFFMSCAELWGYQNGTEWMVSHYLFKKR
ncbi:MAG: class I SAM-dependent methyltransferase [Candidatus Omnitrophica bacterium]|nr:class I SAM-dependent methyltransferase [Candidatus Omnitrophota bacterium]